MKLPVLRTALLLFVTFTLSFSQIKFSAGPYFGFTEPLGDYSGTTVDYYTGTKYGLGGGINFGAVFKVKFSRLNARASLFYTSLDNSGNSLPGRSDVVNVKQNLFMIGIGPEFMFTFPGSRAKPYLNVDLLFTSFSGEVTFHDVQRVPTGTFSMSSATRTGLGLGAGVNIELTSKYSFDVMFRYNFHNLLGKSYTSGVDNRLTSYISLNDDRDPLYDPEDDKHPISSSRSINSIQIDFGFIFDF